MIDWRGRKSPRISPNGMKNLAVIEAPNPEMEALAIAIAMREAAHLQKSAALVTPDRALARRVMAALERWNLDFDDSGGDVLIETSAGIFARLVAEAAANGLEPPTLLALLKHPLCRLGAAAGTHSAAIEALELALLRGTRPQGGTKGLALDFARFRDELTKLRKKEPSSLHRSEMRARLEDSVLDRVDALISALQAALAPMESLSPTRAYDFTEIATRHRELLIALSGDADGIAGAFEGQAGLALASAFDDLLAEQTQSGLLVALPDYPEVFQTAFADRAVRRPERPGASLHIYGPLEFAIDPGRPHHRRRIDRGRMAADAAHRSLAEPTDAARAWPRPAGAAHRAVRSRLRAIAGR